MKFKSLKKASALLLCAVIALAGAVTVFAAGHTYSIPEVADMQLTLPDDMTAVTRSSDPNDRYFSLFGIDYNTNKQNFENSNIYLQGMNSSSSLTVTVTMTETDESRQLLNYNQLEPDKLSEVARNFLSQTEYTACTVDQAVTNIVWLEFNTRVNNSGSLIEAYQANTVFDGKSVNVTLQRNGGNVTADDYQVFSDIIQSVEFNKIALFSFSNPIMPYILIGAGVLLVLIIVFTIIIIRVAARRRKKSKNDKILEELAGKYTVSRPNQAYSEPDNSSEPVKTAEEDRFYDLESFSTDTRSASKGSEGRRYSDEDIDAMLGESTEKPNFIQALPEAEEEQEEVKDDTLSNADPVSEFFEDEPSKPQGAALPATKKFDFPKKSAENTEKDDTEAMIPAEPEPETAQPEQEAAESETAQPAQEPAQPEPQPEEPAAVQEEAPAAEPEEAMAEEKTDSPDDTVADAEFVGEPAEEPQETERSLKDEIRLALKEFESDEENEDEEFNNDEVLVRQEAKRARFADSDDFFEEAPKKTMGVISSKEIRDAEEYDVIGEVERRATEVEKEPPQKGEAVTNALKSAGSGVKSFFTHCGYFITNVKREIKRKKAQKKRQQYEEDRKRRARERAERQRQQAENGGLVQVHKRTDRKPPQRRPGTVQRRPSSQQRRPSTPLNRRGNPPRKR